MSALIVAGLLASSTQPAAAYTLLQVIPIIHVSQIYDDNIELSASHPQGDFVTNIMAGVYLNYHGPERSGSFQYETVGQKFLMHSQFDNIADTHFVQFSDREHLGDRTTLSIRDWFLSGKIPNSPFTTSAGADSVPSLNPQLALALLGRIRSISNFADADLTHRIDERWSVEAGAKHELLSTSQVTTSLTQLSAQSNYALAPRTAVGLGYDYYRFTFSGGSSSVGAHYPQLTARWYGSEELQFDGNIGPVLFRNLDDSQSKVQLGYSATATYHDPVWRVVISGGQEPGITASGGAGITRSASAGAGYAIRRNVTLFAGMGYYQLASGQGNSEVLTYGGGLQYRLKPGAVFYSQYVAIMESDGGVNAFQGTSSGTKGTIRSNAYMFGVTLTFEAFRKAL